MRVLVLGLGYVGAPLALELSKHVQVIGYDTNETRVNRLLAGIDDTNELASADLKSAQWVLSTDPDEISGADVIIVTVPTPVTHANVPDLGPVISATNTIAQHLKPGAIVVYESTVYPGVTEEICVPLLEGTGLKQYTDFNVGYSPERINPGDRVHTLTTVTKIVAADCDEALNRIDALYGLITRTYRASSIKVAEAAKVIENTQRDVNIALMNELTAIFGRLGIDTLDVINAASSKWNFLRFQPGLVGGHCISVDPYYLTHRAQEAGYIPSLILAAREVNDQTPNLFAHRTLQALSNANRMSRARVLVLGCTFKENVPDVRNSKVFKFVEELKAWNVEVTLADPFATEVQLQEPVGVYDAVVLAVPHDEYVQGGWDLIMRHLALDGVCTDLKGVLDRDQKPEQVRLVRP